MKGIRGYRITAIMYASQAWDEGSTPSTRTIKEIISELSPDVAAFHFLCGR